jgi:hypothetical protein
MLDVCVWGNSDGQIPLGRHSMVSMVGRFIIGAVVVVMAAVWLAAIWLMFMDPKTVAAFRVVFLFGGTP